MQRTVQHPLEQGLSLYACHLLLVHLPATVLSNQNDTSDQTCAAVMMCYAVALMQEGIFYTAAISDLASRCDCQRHHGHNMAALTQPEQGCSEDPQ